MEKEIVHSLGKKNCYQVQFPKNCKDSNDVLVKHGKEYLHTINKVLSGKSGNLPAVLEELRLRSVELYERYNKLILETEKFGTEYQEKEFEDAKVWIGSFHESLHLYLDEDPKIRQSALRLLRFHQNLYN